jgi:hypothetical protein
VVRTAADLHPAGPAHAKRVASPTGNRATIPGDFSIPLGGENGGRSPRKRRYLTIRHFDWNKAEGFGMGVIVPSPVRMAPRRRNPGRPPSRRSTRKTGDAHTGA